MKSVKIIVSAYKAQEYIEDFLQSFESQLPTEGWQYDLVIGVDGCKDTACKLDKLDINYAYSDINVGAYVIRNTLIKHNPGDAYIIFDADDIMRNDFITKHLQNIYKTGIVACYKKRFQTTKSLESGTVGTYGGGICAFTDAVWQDIGGFNSDRVASDTDLVIRMILSGKDIFIIEEPLFYYRQHHDSLTGSVQTSLSSDYRKKIRSKHDYDSMSGKIKIEPEVVDMKKVIPSENIDISGKQISFIVFSPKNISCYERHRNWLACKKYWEQMFYDLKDGKEILLDNIEFLEAYPKGVEDFKYNKAHMAHAAVEKSKGEVLVFFDADVKIEIKTLKMAISAVCRDTYRWAAPNTHVLRLTEEETVQHLSGNLSLKYKNAPYIGQDCGGLFVMSKDFWQEIGGFDVRFVGWGGEDSALSILACAYSKPWRPKDTTILWHLWHPEQKSKVTGVMKSRNDSNNKLFNKYSICRKSIGSLEHLKNEAVDEMKVLKDKESNYVVQNVEGYDSARQDFC
jgi:glycosyltransferase involved in cell wall biosynthesis